MGEAGSVRRNQAVRVEASCWMVEASIAIDWPDGAAPRLSQAGTRESPDAAPAPACAAGSAPATAAGAVTPQAALAATSCSRTEASESVAETLTRSSTVRIPGVAPWLTAPA